MNNEISKLGMAAKGIQLIIQTTSSPALPFVLLLIVLVFGCSISPFIPFYAFSFFAAVILTILAVFIIIIWKNPKLLMDNKSIVALQKMNYQYGDKETG